MGILAWIILGALAGWIASLVLNTDQEQGAVANVVIGIFGAIIGGAIMGLIGAEGVSGLNGYSLVVATVGAVALIAVYRAIRGHSE